MRPTKIAYIAGEPDLKSKATSGTIEFFEEELLLSLNTAVTIPFSRIRDVALRRLNGLGSTIQIAEGDGVHSLFVPRVNIGGVLVVVDVIGTQKLFDRLQAAWEGATR